MGFRVEFDLSEQTGTLERAKYLPLKYCFQINRSVNSVIEFYL